MSEPPKKEPFKLDLAGPRIGGPSSVFLWVFFVGTAVVTVMICLLGVLGLASSPLWLAVFIGGSVILIGAGIAAARILGWHGAFAGLIVCVAIVFLLFGTCSQSRYHF